MPLYVDGFVITVPKKNLPAYIKMAKASAKIWKKHGALSYVEASGDDLTPEGISLPFPKLAGAKPSETVLFSFITYKSRRHRDQVLKKVMADPDLTKSMSAKIPFDPKRMAYGGFKSIVQF